MGLFSKLTKVFTQPSIKTVSAALVGDPKYILGEKLAKQTGIVAAAFIPVAGAFVSAGLAAKYKQEQELERARIQQAEDEAAYAAYQADYERQYQAYYGRPPVAPAALTGGRMSLFNGDGGIDLTKILQTGIQAYGEYRTARAQPAVYQQAAFPAVLPALGGMASRALPALRGLAGGGTLAGGAYVAGRAAGAIVRSARIYCTRNPGWCSAIGGTAAVEALLRGGQLPTIRHRRSRGISGKEFRSFRRVHGVLSKFCAPKMHIRRKKR